MRSISDLQLTPSYFVYDTTVKRISFFSAFYVVLGSLLIYHERLIENDRLDALLSFGSQTHRFENRRACFKSSQKKNHLFKERCTTAHMKNNTVIASLQSWKPTQSDITCVIK